MSGNISLPIPEQNLASEEALLLFLRSKAAGLSARWNNVKLVFVGQENVGKTSLLGCLKDVVTNGQSTDGIDIGRLSLGLVTIKLIF